MAQYQFTNDTNTYFKPAKYFNSDAEARRFAIQMLDANGYYKVEIYKNGDWIGSVWTNHKGKYIYETDAPHSVRIGKDGYRLDSVKCVNPLGELDKAYAKAKKSMNAKW